MKQTKGAFSWLRCGIVTPMFDEAGRVTQLSAEPLINYSDA